ncbi:hypothetical protein DFH07DRAFT_448311 [Mycena maculata]|uniref:Uncharacterized protein n=1 Tax=Mycena maculata TaxID=230809 RepID=A0AAD7J946_9AGAR|nr:hypothetical protein DFH07DRAFT_448311 [Mycena maculata]
MYILPSPVSALVSLTVCLICMAISCLVTTRMIDPLPADLDTVENRTTYEVRAHRHSVNYAQGVVTRRYAMIGGGCAASRTALDWFAHRSKANVIPGTKQLKSRSHRPSMNRADRTRITALPPTH